MASERRYGVWAGNPRGIREDPTRCVEPVVGGGGIRDYVSRQCTRKRGHGPRGEYCKQHAQAIERRGYESQLS